MIFQRSLLYPMDLGWTPANCGPNLSPLSASGFGTRTNSDCALPNVQPPQSFQVRQCPRLLGTQNPAISVPHTPEGVIGTLISRRRRKRHRKLKLRNKTPPLGANTQTTRCGRCRLARRWRTFARAARIWCSSPLSRVIRRLGVVPGFISQKSAENGSFQRPANLMRLLAI